MKWRNSEVIPKHDECRKKNGFGSKAKMNVGRAKTSQSNWRNWFPHCKQLERFVLCVHSSTNWTMHKETRTIVRAHLPSYGTYSLLNAIWMYLTTHVFLLVLKPKLIAATYNTTYMAKICDFSTRKIHFLILFVQNNCITWSKLVEKNETIIFGGKVSY